MDRLLLISADCHAGAPEDGYKPYLERRFWDAYDDWMRSEGEMYHGKMEEIMGGSLFHEEERKEWHDDERISSGGKTGVFRPERRIRELELDGCVGEVIFPDHQNYNEPPFGVIEDLGGYPAEQQRAGAQAYNRWLAEFCSSYPDRMAGIALVPIDDIETAIDEVLWARKAGLRGGIVLPLIPDHAPLPQYHHPRYEPLWAVCEELDMPVHTHATGGTPNYGRYPGSEAAYITEVTWYAHRPLWFLMWAGVFERHPRLKFVMTEQGADWIGASLAQLDGMYTSEKHPHFREGLSLTPTEYFKRQCFFGGAPASSATRAAIGSDKIMWGSDYPHLEGTWPHTQERLRERFSDVPEPEARLILGQTAAGVYNFDLDRLQPVIERVCQPYESLFPA